MNNISTYLIEVRGRLEEEDVNTMSPLKLSVEWVGQEATLLTVRTDQSGLIGLMRHLHGLGFVFLSMKREL